MVFCTRLALALMLAAAAAPARAQAPTDPVAPLRQAYEALDFAAARARGQALLGDPAGLSPSHLVETHTLLALVAFAQADTATTRLHFQAALSLDPRLRLDPVLVAPNALAFFEAVRAASAGPPPAAGAAALRYVLVQDRRPAAALRSMLLPGWGQLYAGRRGRAAAFGGAFALTAGGAAAAHLRYDRLYARYEAADDPDAVGAAYDRANRWLHARNNLLVGAGVVWAAAYVEALVAGGASAPGAGRRLTWSPLPGGLNIHVSF